MMNLLKIALALGLALLATNAWAVDAGTRQVITDAVHKLVPKAEISAIEKAPIANMYVVVASGQVVYVSADGTYMLHGDLYNLETRSNLTATRMNHVRKAAMAKIGPDDRLRFAPENPQYHVTVFTDIDCGYCRKLHSHIKQITAEGITVDYLFFPRTGLDSSSFDKAVSVWCADDPKAALTKAKTGWVPPSKVCDNPVAEDYKLGQRLGITGTPTIIADDGSVIGGYLRPKALLQRLQAVAAKMQGNAGAARQGG